ncbi:MAG TPA: hypothetical protein VGJ70_15280 [Solirubrobacteraceae bacterium]
MSRNQRLGLLGLAAVVIVVAIVAIGSGGSSDSKKAVTSATIVVKGGKPVGGIAKPVFKKGSNINLTVRSDVADEVHFHGYDVHKDVTKGGSVTFDMPATIEGRFVVELEHRGEQLAEVEVKP